MCFFYNYIFYNFRSDMNEIKHLISQKSDPEDTYELLDILGQGSYGSVSKALHKATGQLYAIKILPATSGVQISAIKKQIGILKQCDDVHIVKYFGSYFKDNNLWIVMEYCIAGSMADIMQITKKKFNENQIASILQSVLKGLDYLHSHKKIHRDIKAANILLDKQGNAKLADFGVSASALETNARFRTHIGSPYWMSPQIIKYSEYTYKTDIWSLGITAIELAEGQVPNSQVKPYRIPLIIKKKPVQSFKDPSLWSQQFNNFIKECLQISPSDRPQARQLLQHPFIKKYSKGQRLLSELVLSSIQEIQQFRVNQSRDNSFAQIIIDQAREYVEDGAKTLVERQHGSHEEHEEQEMGENGDNGDNGDQEGIQGGSMIIINSSRSNSCTGTVIAADNSMIQHDQEDLPKPVDPLTSYINGLKKQSNVQIKCMQKLVQALNSYDEQVTLQLRKIFDTYKQKVKVSIQSIQDMQKNNPHLKENSQYKCRLKDANSLEQFFYTESKIRQKKTSSTLLVNSRLKIDQETTPHSKIQVKNSQSTQIKPKDENVKKGDEGRDQVKSFLIPNNDTYPSDMWKSKKSYIQTQNNHLLDQNNSNDTQKIQKPLSNAHNSSRIMIKRTDPYNQIASSQVVREFANDPQVLQYLRQKNYLNPTNPNSSSINYIKSTFQPVYTCSSINSRQFLYEQRSTEKSKSKSKNKVVKNGNKGKKGKNNGKIGV